MNFRKAIMEGKPLEGVRVIDVHVHCGNGNTWQVFATDGNGIVHTMERLGLDTVCICPFGLSSDPFRINDRIAKELASHPKEFKGYVFINPYYEDLDIEKYLAMPGFIGLKEITVPYYAIKINDPRYERYYEIANKRKLPVLVHTWMKNEVEELLDLVRRYPDVKFIAAHSSSTYYDAKLALIEGMKKYDNIIADTTISGTYDGTIEWFVDKVGDDRVVYGSDMASFECSQTLGRVAMAKLPERSIEKILGLNAAAWLNL